MKIENFVSELSVQYQNGRHIHPIREKGYQIMYYVNHYLKTHTKSSLFIAYEHMKTLNKKINGNLSLKNIDELKDCDLVDEIEKLQTID